MAKGGYGAAVIPSILRPDRGNLRMMRVTHRGELLQIALAVIWDKRRTLPRYAQGFSEALADHLRAVFPAARPGRVNGKSARPANSKPAPRAGAFSSGARRARARGA